MFKSSKIYLSQVLVLIMCLSLASFTPLTASAQTTVNSSEEYRQYLYARLAELQAQLLVLLKIQADRAEIEELSEPLDRREVNPHFMQIITLAPSSVTKSSARLLAEADRGSADESEVWFRYGVGNTLNKNSKSENISRWSRKTTVPIVLTDLESNTKYSYRAVIEDQDGHRQFGQIRTFVTPSSATTVSFTGRPFVETDGVTNVRSNSAELRAFVSMNDFDDGILFFNYGSDIGDINDVEDYDTYAEVPTVRGITGKTLVAREFIGRDIIKLRVSGLKRATKYYYNVCVEYRDRGDNIRCSDTETFVTLN